MNALDLRADHPELLRDYTHDARPIASRVVDAFRRFVPSARLKPMGAQ